MDASSRVYVRPDVQVEPLVDQWYAWSRLIPSATAARNVTGRHLQIMDCSGGALRGVPGGGRMTGGGPIRTIVRTAPPG